VNLTIPHKVRALSLVGHVEPEAAEMGAVNTLLWTGTEWIGHNTDGYGFESAVREELGLSLAGRHVVLLGAGGAARAIAARCLRSGCASIWIGNRGTDRLRDLLGLLAPLDGRGLLHGFDLTTPPFDTLPADALVVNATSLGLKADDPVPVDVRRLRGQPSVYDTTYGRHRSRLVLDAEQCGLRVATGLSMLVWQGVRSLEIWTKHAIPVNAMRQGAIAALSHDA
jgi:shikimate dehydrogenase